jgi:transposase
MSAKLVLGCHLAVCEKISDRRHPLPLVEQKIAASRLGLEPNPKSVLPRSTTAMGPVRCSTRSARALPWLAWIWVDGAYNARHVDTAVAKVPLLCMEIVKPRDVTKGFVVLPRRWVVERTFSWFERDRPLAKNLDNLAAPLATFVASAPSSLPSGGLPGRSL